MARRLGVEARVAYGWAGGEYFAESRMFVFRAREAHAWVEVKMKGVWVVMEPTPPVALGGGGSPRVADAEDKPPTAEEELSEEPEETADQGGEVEKIALALMAAFGGVAVGVFLFRGLRQGERFAGDQEFPGAKRRGGYFGLWRQACEKKGLAVRAGWTLKRQLAEMEEPPAFAEDLREYHYALRYEEKPPDADREGRLVSEIKRWE
jgi:hypothetical protein